MSADDRQVGGAHYKGDKIKPEQEHWNLVVAYDLGYFEAQIVKYVLRWKKKNGIEDLKKAQHFLEKYIELNQPKPVILSEPVDPVGFSYQGSDSFSESEKKRIDEYTKNYNEYMKTMREPKRQEDTGVPGHRYVDQG